MHTIRLRGPWVVEGLARYVPRNGGGYEQHPGSGLPPGRARMPADWRETLGRDFLGVVRYTRNFNRPTNLDPHERVWLVVEPPRSRGLVRVNGRELGFVRYGTPAERFDITAMLEDHNAVVIDVEHPELDDEGSAIEDGSFLVTGGLVGDVYMEIEG